MRGLRRAGVCLGVLVALGVGPGCQRQRGPAEATEDPATREENKRAQQMANRAELLFARRDDPSALKEAISFYERAAVTLPDPALQLRLARSYELLGRQVRAPSPREEAALRKKSFEKGRESAERALAGRVPGILLDLGRDPVAAASRAGPADAAFLYTYALLLWREAGEQGTATQLAKREIVVALVQRAELLDPNYLGRAPARLLGEVYAELPRFAGGDLTRSRAFFEASFRDAPGALENRAACARTYAAHLDVALARTFYEEILAADPEVSPELAPENRIERRLATEALKELPLPASD